MKVQAIGSHVLYWKNGEFTTITCTGDKLQDAIKEWAHGRELAHRTCGSEHHYQFDGYEWYHREVIEQRNRDVVALLTKLQELEDDDIFSACIPMYKHLRHASIVNIDGQWFIIDVVNDPVDYDASIGTFGESIAVHAHSYDQDGEDIVIHWDDLIDGIEDGGMELMRVMPMAV